MDTLFQNYLIIHIFCISLIPYRYTVGKWSQMFGPHCIHQQILAGLTSFSSQINFIPRAHLNTAWADRGAVQRTFKINESKYGKSSGLQNSSKCNIQIAGAAVFLIKAKCVTTLLNIVSTISIVVLQRCPCLQIIFSGHKGTSFFRYKTEQKSHHHHHHHI